MRAYALPAVVALGFAWYLSLKHARHVGWLEGFRTARTMAFAPRPARLTGDTDG